MVIHEIMELDVDFMIEEGMEIDGEGGLMDAFKHNDGYDERNGSEVRDDGGDEEDESRGRRG